MTKSLNYKKMLFFIFIINLLFHSIILVGISKYKQIQFRLPKQKKTFLMSNISHHQKHNQTHIYQNLQNNQLQKQDRISNQHADNSYLVFNQSILQFRSLIKLRSILKKYNIKALNQIKQRKLQENQLPDESNILNVTGIPQNLINFLLCQTNKGYYRDFATLKCQSCSVQKCKNCPLDQCIQCKYDLIIKYGQCMKQNCPQFSRNCLYNAFTKTNLATTCVLGFYQQRGVCRSCRTRCKQCTRTNNNCQSCQDGFFSTYLPNIGEYRCKRCQKHCLQCNDQVSCNQCVFGYSLRANQSSCYKCSYPCSICVQPSTGIDSTQQCLKCFSPYRINPNPNGVCIRCKTLNCFICPQNVCSICQSLYQLNDQTKQCELICDPNCNVCLKGDCVLCNQRYRTFTNSTSGRSQCQLCSVNNCKFCLENVCQQCISGTFLNSQGQCQFCDDICITCQQSNSCLSYRKIGRQTATAYSTLVNSPIVCKNGCKSCYTYTASPLLIGFSSPVQLYCTKAYQGFYVSDGDIFPCGGKCLQCYQEDDYIQCVQCPQGYTVSDPTLNLQLCIPCTLGSNCNNCLSTDLSKCTTCVLGFYWEDYQCFPCTVQNCQICDPHGQCQQCLIGYGVSQDNLECVECFLTCLQCSGADPRICYNCGEGYYLTINNTCGFCMEGCVSCDNQYTCNECQYQFNLDRNKICRPKCQYPCLLCQSLRSNCSACAQGYILSQIGNGLFTCKIQQQCQSGCLFCAQGYFPVGQRCISCSVLNCAYCDPGSLYCQSCITGYYYQSNTACSQCPVGCYSCVSSQICFSCKKGWTFLRNRDQQVFTGNGKGLCIACNSPCKTCFGSPDRCRQCIDGYTYDRWKCLKNSKVTYLIGLTISPQIFFANFNTVKRKIVNILGSGFQQNPNYIASYNYEIIDNKVFLKQQISIPDGQSASLSAQDMIKSIIVGQNLLTLQTKSTTGQIVQYTVNVNYFSITDISQGQSSSSNPSKSSSGIGIAIGVGILALIIIVIVIISCILVKRSNAQHQIKILHHGYKGQNEDIKQIKSSAQSAINLQQFDL